ncbi:MAG: hypothetical protein H6510_05650 [Acidobacteria bacterium]|nr:hypothetical protein [Acidobacteriota bacterium]MCB9397277.1 hypothetical protein [Acidobacteriota bacterium]
MSGQEAEGTYYRFNEQGYMVMLEPYHLMRGYCCGCECAHCPYEPQYEKGSRQIRDEVKQAFADFLDRRQQ